MNRDEFIRRDFLKSIGLGTAMIAVPWKLSSEANTISLSGESTGLINIIDFGAKGDATTDNTMHNGALTNLLLDKGGHGDNVIVKDNVGQLMVTQ